MNPVYTPLPPASPGEGSMVPPVIGLMTSAGVGRSVDPGVGGGGVWVHLLTTVLWRSATTSDCTWVQYSCSSLTNVALKQITAAAEPTGCCCLLVVLRPSNTLVSLRGGSAQRSVRAATLRKKLQTKLSSSPWPNNARRMAQSPLSTNL